MSFRKRLTSFFVLIVVVPMLAIGFLVFRLIGDSAQGKADARANGVATTAASIYASERASAAVAAKTIARDAALLNGPERRSRLASLATQSGLARVRVREAGRLVADVGQNSAIAPGVAVLRRAGAARISVRASALTAPDYARELAGPGLEVVVIEAGRVIGSTLAKPPPTTLPAKGTVVLGGRDYRALTQSFQGFDRTSVNVTVLSSISATSASVGSNRAVAVAFIAGFLLLALGFSVLASRALQGQLARFLQAARRMGRGDFASSVPIEGNDEFAELGEEFNNMSRQLAGQLQELSEEQARLRESIRRSGETFASNLDRPALLGLALRTAIDAARGESGRLSVRHRADEPLSETARVGALAAVNEPVYQAERAALRAGGLGEVTGEINVVSISLGSLEGAGRARGLITVVRRGTPFDDDDRDLLRSLAAQATLALENVELHFQVRRQAVTDELTGLANHGRFQERLDAETEQVRRYHYPVGLIMLDIDDFKEVNDTYGHQQGDIVLKHVARALGDTSRETDTPARYGGEELALILPHTDLEGSYSIAERLRASIEELRIPRVGERGFVRVTASVGVTASSEGVKDRLIAEADAALYAAKRQGKNRTVRAQATTANLSSGQ